MLYGLVKMNLLKHKGIIVSQCKKKNIVIMIIIEENHDEAHLHHKWKFVEGAEETFECSLSFYYHDHVWLPG